MNMCQQRYVCLTEHAPAVGLTRDARFCTPDCQCRPDLYCVMSSGVTKSSTTGMSSGPRCAFPGGPGVGRDPCPEDLAHLEAAARRMEASYSWLILSAKMPAMSPPKTPGKSVCSKRHKAL